MVADGCELLFEGDVSDGEPGNPHVTTVNERDELLLFSFDSLTALNASARATMYQVPVDVPAGIVRVVEPLTEPLTIEPNATAGTVTLKYRGTIGDERDPHSIGSGTLDQQGYNVATTSFNVVVPVPAPDLYFVTQSGGAWPDPLIATEASNELVASVRIGNEGAVASRSDTEVAAILSTNNAPSDLTGTTLLRPFDAALPVYFASLQPGEISSQTQLRFHVPSTVAAGSYWLKLQIDPLDLNDDAQRIDNVTVLGPFTIAASRTFGTTVITHGYQFDQQCRPLWMLTLAEAIRGRLGKGRIFFYNRATGTLDQSGQVFVNGSCVTRVGAQDSGGEAIILHDWADESDRFYRGLSEAAAEAMVATLLDSASNLDLSNLHLIGHSRGTVVNSEIAERLLVLPSRGTIHMTMLDPHDFGLAGLIVTDYDVNEEHDSYPSIPGPFGRSGVNCWQNLDYCDNYYQYDDDSALTGRSIAGSMNANLTTVDDSPPGENMDHSGIHGWYHFTTDLVASNDGDAINHDPDWFGMVPLTPCVSERNGSLSQSKDGYFLSRATGGVSRRCAGDGVRPLSQFDFESAHEGIVNGDFARGSSDASSGWKYHGGGGGGTIDNEELMLLSGQFQKHNRLYVPPTATFVSFRYEVRTADTSGQLFVRVGTSSGAGETVQFPIGSTVAATRSVPVAQAIQGRMIDELRFSVSGLNGRVAIDNVHFVTGNVPTVTIEAVDASAGEPTDAAQVRVRRSVATATPLTVNLLIAGSAQNGGDYQNLLPFATIASNQTETLITISPIDDGATEAVETIQITLTDGTGYAVGSSNSVSIDLNDNDTALPTVTIFATDSSAAEAGLDAGQFTISRTGATTTSLAGNVSIGGTASAGSDYQTLLTGWTIPAGQSSITIAVAPIDDGAYEESESLMLTLANSAAYLAGTPSSATVWIASNDPLVLQTPANLIASAAASTQVNVSWSAVGGAHHYEVYRSANNNSFTLVGSPTLASHSDQTAAGTAYVYKARAVGPNGELSSYSNADVATTIIFSDDPVAAGQTTIRAIHITQLRTAANLLRSLAGLGPFPFTDATLSATAIKSIHLQELRTALAPARSALAVPAITYTNALAAGTVIRAIDLNETRNGVK